jgi:hypothetical protein
MFTTPLALAISLFPPGAPDASGLPPAHSQARWAAAAALQFAGTLTGAHGAPCESVAMMDGLISGYIGPGQGWFQPGQSRYGWRFLAGRMDADGDGQITREEFRGPDEFFDRLDKNKDGMLTAEDFAWPLKPPPSPPLPKSAPPGLGIPTRELLMTALLRDELGSPCEGPRVGQRAPLFTLPTQDDKRVISLADELGRKPVVLIFGSFT